LRIERGRATQDEPDLVLTGVRVQVRFSTVGDDLNARIEMIGTHQTGRSFAVLEQLRRDGEGLEVGAFDVTRLATVKRKQKSGLHEVYVVNPDGRRSNTLQFVVE